MFSPGIRCATCADNSVGRTKRTSILDPPKPGHLELAWQPRLFNFELNTLLLASETNLAIYFSYRFFFLDFAIILDVLN